MVAKSVPMTARLAASVLAASIGAKLVPLAPLPSLLWPLLSPQAARANPPTTAQAVIRWVPIWRNCRCCMRSEEHTSELQSLMRISYAVFCLKKKKKQNNRHKNDKHQDKNNKQQTTVE